VEFQRSLQDILAGSIGGFLASAGVVLSDHGSTLTYLITIYSIEYL